MHNMYSVALPQIQCLRPFRSRGSAGSTDERAFLVRIRRLKAENSVRVFVRQLGLYGFSTGTDFVGV